MRSSPSTAAQGPAYSPRPNGPLLPRERSASSDRARVAADLVAIAVFAAINAFLLGKFGVSDWRDNDGSGYVALAEQLRHWSTWVSVPDLSSALMPLSLLRIPGYSLLIIAAQTVAGEFWIAALIGFQLCCSVIATFILYRAIWAFSGLWVLGVLAAGWFASSYVGYFNRFVLPDSLTISLFTGTVSWLALAAFRRRALSRIEGAAIGTSFVVLFLLREANLLFAFALAPLILLALSPERRWRGLAGVYIPLLASFLLVGAWQHYRTGHFLITTGGQGNPIGAVAIADKLEPVLDQNGPVDRVVREATAGMTIAEINDQMMPIILQINERLAAELDIRGPGLSRLLLGRYVSAWLQNPSAMLEFAKRHEPLIRIAGVSPFIYDDARLSATFRSQYSYRSQQVVVWALMLLPIAWLILLIFPAFRRTSLIALSLWAFAIATVGVYGVMYFEIRYVLHALGPMLMIIALAIGGALRFGAAALAFGRERIARGRSGAQRVYAGRPTVGTMTRILAATAWFLMIGFGLYVLVPGSQVWLPTTETLAALLVLAFAQLSFDYLVRASSPDLLARSPAMLPDGELARHTEPAE